MLPSKIRLMLNLSVVALRRELDKQLAMWYCLGAMGYWGSGCLDLQMAVETLTNWFRYSKSSAYRIFDSVDGIFRGKRTIGGVNKLEVEIYSVKRVVKYTHVFCGYIVKIAILKSAGLGGQSVICP